ncbi:hypothetical protein BBK36DRAFT_1145017 [Trichoderma citrinoviride]|uniref:Uncharacterized protein n=1 Tax=Trichoderma citrinoviride TaxID=58853 RepID=A0A2T4AYS8_9HYPO|nr:hypothetical protein BBK36DRAFT_1145017 [Trichoderma citrinoviride]PTB62226.1 hypothetical protein BBK36DRAFT_1145017 [Trichoderma citrinoviride]
MAEIEMDVDLAPSIHIDEHADDDLIDYDIDTTEDHTHDPWPSHHDEQTSNAPENVSSIEEHPKAAVTVYEEEIITLEEEEPKDAPVTETEHAADEIDYEDNDVTVTQESPNKLEEAEDHVHDIVAADDVAAAEPAMAEPSSLPQPTEQPAGDAEVPEAAAQDDEDEITWEHEYDEKGAAVEAPTEAPAEAPAEATTQEAVPQNRAESQSSDSHEHVHEPHTNATETDYEDTAKEASAEQESVEHQEDDSRSQPEESSPGGEDEFPPITVHYKGSEYSFFSHKKTEGFFSDVSVLDQSMESLLAGFRAELENEIAAHDELVFQVDELGLEFAEATIQNSLASITFRQVLEVFDLLVKNQDPDSSRTLYTYLFTKPNPSKRFEFLVESAAASKGLDEVIYLFESPAGHPHQTATEADDGDDYEHDEDSEANEAAEAHESAEDGDEHDEEHGDVDADTEESQESEEDEGEEETSAVEEQRADNADQDDEEDEEEEEEEEEEEAEEDEEDEDEAEDFMEDVEDFNGEAEETANQDEGDYSDGGDGGYQHEQLQAVVVEAAGHSDFPHANAEAKEAPDATYSYDDAEEDADANPFIHAELQESAGDNGGEIQFEQTVPAEAGEKVSQEMPMQSIDDYIDANEADTGTTNTLADNGEGISTLLDMGTVQDLEEEITNEDLAFEDEMPEIDWRDDVEVAKDASSAMPTTTTGLPKRRRPEEEQDEADEQDAKRLRS